VLLYVLHEHVYLLVKLDIAYPYTRIFQVISFNPFSKPDRVVLTQLFLVKWTH
jgi:hypothetical protein